MRYCTISDTKFSISSFVNIVGVLFFTNQDHNHNQKYYKFTVLQRRAFSCLGKSMGKSEGLATDSCPASLPTLFRAHSAQLPRLRGLRAERCRRRVRWRRPVPRGVPRGIPDPHGGGGGERWWER